jgi:hypothetical protein
MTAHVPARKYIFCVSPGRSGTYHLSHVFSAAGNVCAVHEPEHQWPAYAALRPHRWDLKNRFLSDSFTERQELKLSQISDLMSRSTAHVYAETNPLFSTLWHDVILDGLSGHELVVIILRRSAVKVLKSLLDLGWFHTRRGDAWMVTAYSVNSLIRPVGPETEATAFHLVISHLLNVEMYAVRIKARCLELGHRTIDLRSDDLFGEPDTIHRMLAQCGLSAAPPGPNDATSTHTSKPGTRNKLFDIPLDRCAMELDAYLARCASNGVQVPDSLYL